MSWKPEVQVAGSDGWHGNNLAFATLEEAVGSAEDLAARWMLVTAHRACESDQPVNAVLADGELSLYATKEH